MSQRRLQRDHNIHWGVPGWAILRYRASNVATKNIPPNSAISALTNAPEPVERLFATMKSSPTLPQLPAPTPKASPTHLKINPLPDPKSYSSSRSALSLYTTSPPTYSRSHPPALKSKICVRLYPHSPSHPTLPIHSPLHPPPLNSLLTT